MRDEKGKKGLKFIFQGLDEINRHLWLCEENNVFYKDNGDFYPTKFYSCNGISFFGDLGIPLNIDCYNITLDYNLKINYIYQCNKTVYTDNYFFVSRNFYKLKEIKNKKYLLEDERDNIVSLSEDLFLEIINPYTKDFNYSEEKINQILENNNYIVNVESLFHNGEILCCIPNTEKIFPSTDENISRITAQFPSINDVIFIDLHQNIQFLNKYTTYKIDDSEVIVPLEWSIDEKPNKVIYVENIFGNDYFSKIYFYNNNYKMESQILKQMKEVFEELGLKDELKKELIHPNLSISELEKIYQKILFLRTEKSSELEKLMRFFLDYIYLNSEFYFLSEVNAILKYNFEYLQIEDLENIDIYNKLVVNEELNKIAKKYCERISSLQDLKNTHLNNNYIDLLIKLSGNS